MTTKINILIVEDHPDAGKLLVNLISQLSLNYAPTLATSLTEALCLLDKQSWDIFLVDLALPDGSGISFIEAAKQKFSSAPLVVTTIFDDDTNLFNALAAGATGYLLKSQTPSQLKEELSLLKQGFLPMSPSIAQRVLNYFQQAPSLFSKQKPAELSKAEEKLTPRETEVLMAIAKGSSNKEVAAQLGLAEQTVASYIKIVYQKLNIRNRAQATLAAQRQGLI